MRANQIQRYLAVYLSTCPPAGNRKIVGVYLPHLNCSLLRLIPLILHYTTLETQIGPDKRVFRVVEGLF